MTASPPGEPPGWQHPGWQPPDGQPPNGTDRYGYPPATQPEVCSWHPGRATALHCTRCGRAACPDCLTPASVGFHCRACVAESKATQRTARTVTGAPHGQQPIVTYVLIALNVLVFAVTAVQSRSVSTVGDSGVFEHGALTPIMVSSGEYWRLLTSGFLHEGLLHIALNMLALYFIGLALERIIGRWRYLAVYLISLLGGSAIVMVFSAFNSSTIGASGAIFGLMGALVVTFKRFHFDLRQLVIIVGINLFITFRIAGISWQGHLGGLVVGALIGAAMVYPPARTRRAWQIGSCVAVLAALAGLVIYRDAQLAAQWGHCVQTADHFYCQPPQG